METIVNNFTHYLQSNFFLACLFAYLAGLLTSFTPCMYPMIPVTISFIGGLSLGKRNKAFLLVGLYVLGMAIIYTVLGIIAALTGTIFGAVSSNPLLYFILGNICILFGLSMLDVFSLPLPLLFSSIQAKVKFKGYLGAFLFGLTSGSVAAPCAVPVLGTILAIVASRKSIFFGVSLLVSFSIGLGTLLLVIGAFTGILTSIPRSGNWMVIIKKFLALLIIACGEYFLINMGMLLVK